VEVEGKSLLRALVAAFVVLGMMGAVVPAADAVMPAVASVTAWKQNAAPMGWSASLNRVIYNSRGGDGMFDAYSAAPDGSDPQCLTCAIPSFPGVGAATNRGVSDVSPDGRHMLLEVESGEHSGQVGSAISEPGKGAYNDVWLATTDGTKAWPLTDVAADGGLGTMWARFDRAGERIVWAELSSPAILNLGYWRLKVADIVWTAGVPTLSNIQTIEPAPDHFYEPYGFSPDDSHIIVASDIGMPNWWDSQIYSIAIDGTGLMRLSPADAPTGFFTNYNEFAFYRPGDNAIIYGRTRGAASGGMDYWLMNPDGTGSQRLTYFNEPWDSEYLGYTVVGGLAFDPHNPNRFVADVASDMNATNLNAVMVTLSDPASTGALTGQYFADATFTRLAATRQDDPWSGFKWDASPMPGMPTSFYSVRWTGALAPTVTGTYTLCAVADSGMRVWVNGALLIDGWGSFGKRQCASATLQAGAPSPIRIDYWHGAGTAYGQLTSTGPGSATPIPVQPAAAPSPPLPSPTTGRAQPKPTPTYPKPKHKVKSHPKPRRACQRSSASARKRGRTAKGMCRRLRRARQTRAIARH
jgi:hypothetical protein